MSKEHVAKAMDKIVADPAFRKRLEHAPKETLAEEGLELTDEELEKLSGGGISFQLPPTFAPPYVPVAPAFNDPLLPPGSLPKKP